MTSNLIIILITTAIVFVFYRIFWKFSFKHVFNHFGQSNTNNFDLLVSFSVLITFELLLVSVIRFIALSNSMTNLDWYIVTVLFGISSLLWCYFDWDISIIISIPKFAPLETTQKKKCIVFSFVLAYSIWLGYQKVSATITGATVDASYIIIDTTIIASMIATDRVLSQLYSLLKKDN